MNAKKSTRMRRNQYLPCHRCGQLWAVHREAGMPAKGAANCVGYQAPTGGAGRPAWMRGETR